MGYYDNKNNYQLSNYYDYQNQYNQYYGYNNRNSGGGSFNSRLTAALVLGIISTSCAAIFGLFFGLLNLLTLGCGIIGIVLAVPCRKALIRYRLPTGKATAALTLSIIGTCLSGLSLLGYFLLWGAYTTYYYW